jgi:hypothetical protein
VNFSPPDDYTHADTTNLLQGEQCNVDNDDKEIMTMMMTTMMAKMMMIIMIMPLH